MQSTLDNFQPFVLIVTQTNDVAIESSFKDAECLENAFQLAKNEVTTFSITSYTTLESGFKTKSWSSFN